MPFTKTDQKNIEDAFPIDVQSQPVPRTSDTTEGEREGETEGERKKDNEKNTEE